MAVQRRRRLHEVRRLGGRARGVLLDPAAVGEVDGDDLRRLHGREVARLASAIRSPVSSTIAPLSRRPHTGSPACSTRTRRCVSAAGMAHNVSILFRLSRPCEQIMYALLCCPCSRSTASWISPTSASVSRPRGDIAPGARLAQVELAERLGISRTPVREALRRLSAEGLVDSHPNRGFWVAELSLDAVLRRLEVRLLLERASPASPPSAAASVTWPNWSARSRARRRRAPAARPTTRAASSTSSSPARPATTSTSASSTRSGWSSGRRLLSRRATEVEWQGADVSEHREIAQAVAEPPRRRRSALDGGARARRRPALGTEALVIRSP